MHLLRLPVVGRCDQFDIEPGISKEALPLRDDEWHVVWVEEPFEPNAEFRLGAGRLTSRRHRDIVRGDEGGGGGRHNEMGQPHLCCVVLVMITTSVANVPTLSVLASIGHQPNSRVVVVVNRLECSF